MLKTLVKTVILGSLVLVAASAFAVNHYVSPDGSDTNSGDSPLDAWATIDYGDNTGQVDPGDTVFILSGTYETTTGFELNTGGNPSLYIVYMALGREPVILDGKDSAETVLTINGNYTRVYGLEVTRASHDGILAQSRYGILAECYVHDCGWSGIVLDQLYESVHKNICVFNGASGIQIAGLGDYSPVCGNTCCFNGLHGIYAMSSSVDIIVANNILCSNGSYGIEGNSSIICMYNNVWDNEQGYYLFCRDTLGGGISVNPQFVDAANGRFDVKHTSGVIDAGIDLGDTLVYDFNGAAPDIGAVEKYNRYYVSIDGNDSADGRSSATAWRTIDNGESLLLPGDTVFVQPGVYSDSVILTDGGLENDLICFVGNGDDCSIDGSGYNTAVKITGYYVSWSGIDIHSAYSCNIHLSSVGTRLSNCELSNSSVGLLAWGREIIVTNNVFHHNLGTGIYNFSSLNDSYHNNTFYHNGTRDIKQVFPFDFTVFNNIFVSDSPSDTAIDASDWSNISHCFFYGYDEAVSTSGEPGEGCFVGVDPRLIDPNKGNFHLDFASPAIDAGKDLGYPYNGYAPDIGAFETGLPAYMYVMDNHDTLIADLTYQFGLVTYDSEGYPTRPGPVIWSHTFETGSISSSGLFTPGLVDSGQVVAEAAVYGLKDTSAVLTVVAGDLHELEINPSSAVLEIGSSMQFDLLGEDVKGNPVSEYGVVSWETFNGVGTIDQNGLFTATRVGYGVIRAISSLGPIAVSDTITVTAGDPQIQVTSLLMPVKDLVPGTSTGPLLALEFVNDHFAAVPLDSIRLQFTGSDPGGASQEELDSQIQAVALYLEKDNQYTTLSDSDSLVCLADVSNGYVMMHTDGLYVPANGGFIRMTVVADLDAQTTKNENTIGFQLTEESDVYLGQVIPVVADFPLDNDVEYIVNAFPAALASVTAVPATTLYQGQTNRLVLDFELPSNGYAADYLSSVKLINLGTYDDNGQMLNVHLRADLTGDGFSTDDVNLGSFTYATGFWRLPGLSYPLANYSTRFFVTVDIMGGQFDGGTLDFSIPTKGIEYISGTDGPDDISMKNPTSFVIMPADRVTAVSVPRTSTTVRPGSSGNTVLAFALYNGYGVSKQLTAVRFTNHSKTASSSTYADNELGQVSLHFDANNNRLFDGDPAVASGYFSNGLLNLSPSNLTLPAESLCYFFVAVHLPTENVIDSDSLAVGIDNESDIMFEVVDGEIVSINGDMPLSSGAYAIVNGSVRAQYDMANGTSSSLAPGDTSVLLFCFTPAVNGDQNDTLMSLTLANAGSADETDIETIELWLDKNGDHLWQSDDSLVKSFSYTGSNWTAENIGLETSPSSACLFVTGDVASEAMSGASFQAVIPQNGCQFTSGNDGPNDGPLVGEAEFVISASGLRITAAPLSGSYSIGQEISVSANVRNLLGSPMENVYCEFVAVNNAQDSIVLGPMWLDPGETVEYTGSFTASQVGQETWRIMAFSSVPVDSSAPVYTDEVHIDQVPSEVSLNLLNSIPTAVSRGQSNIFPLSIAFEQVDTASTYSSLRLDSIQISVEDVTGAPQNANTVFSRMVLATDNVNLVVENNIPSSPSVWLRFSAPIIVDPGEQQLLSLLVDIDSSATATGFVLVLNAPSDINIVDRNTMSAVPFTGDVIFPMSTASCRIDEPSHELAVSSQSILNDCVNLGQLSVGGLDLSIRHPGSLGASQIQLTRLEMELIDDTQATIDAYGIISALKILKQQTVVGQLNSIQPGTTNLVVNFTAPPTLSPDETEQLRIEFDIRSSTTHDVFGVRINDSTAFTVRDLTSGSLITAASDVELATGNVFPILSELAQVKTPAVGAEICLTSVLTEEVIGGTNEVPMVEIALMYPVTDDYSSLRADEIVVRVYDSTGVFVNPRELFDQIGISVNGDPVAYNPFIELRDGFTVFHLGDEGLSIAPGDTTIVTLVADIETATPVENFKLAVQNDCALTVCDATDTTSHPTSVASPWCPLTYPFESGLAHVYLQAGRPAVSTTVPPAQLAYPGQSSLRVMDLTFTYDSPVLQGDLVLNRMIGEVIERTASAASQKSPATIFNVVMLMIDDDTLAIDSVFAGDSVSLVIESGLTISRGDSYQLSLRCDISDQAPLGNYMISMNDSTFCDLRDKNILTVLSPYLTDGRYPLLSAEVSLVAASLENSFTNYPNPFNPEMGDGTTIGFVLMEDARVDIELFTITGKLVKQVTVDAFRGAGTHQQDKWDGRNERGMTVIPGTYFCRVTANYLSGKSETFKRKISVVR